MKLNQPLKLEPKKSDKIHRDVSPYGYLLHALSVCVMALVCIGTDVGIIHWMNNKPRIVQWPDGTIQTNFVHTLTIVPTNSRVEFGLCNDGTAIWRIKK